MYINDIAENIISLSHLFEEVTSFRYSKRNEFQIQTVIDHHLQEGDEWTR